MLVLVGVAVKLLTRQGQAERIKAARLSGELPPLAMSEVPDFNASAPTSQNKPEANTTAPAADAANSWQDQAKALRDAGNYDAALVLCQQQFPKAQAFQQAAILLRLQMKQLLEQKQDIAPLLVKLYRCAVLADLFRTTAPHKPNNPRQALKALANQEFPYLQLGHNELKLLGKGDCKLLEQRWGVPRHHQHAEMWLGAQWENLCQ